MFEHLECGHERVMVRELAFKPAGIEVLRVLVEPAEIEAAVAHHPNKHAVTTAEVEGARGRGKIDEPGDDRGELRSKLVALDRTGVESRDRLGGRSVEPVRVLCL